MEIRVRVTQATLTPLDTSGFELIAEVADASAFTESVMRRPDDGADNWPLGKRYQEIVDARQQAERERDEALSEARAAEGEEARWRANHVEALTALAAERAARAEAESEVERLRVLLGAARGAIMTVPECIWSNPTPVGDEGLYRISAFLADINAALAPRAEDPT
jgi:hypothetical protein